MALAFQMARIPSSFMARLAKDLLRIKGSDIFIDIFLIYPRALLYSGFQRGRLWATSVYALIFLSSLVTW